MRLIPTALTATLALQVTCACATENPQGFRIMEPAEITRHLNAMQKLDGEEREQYRDRIYAELRERARAGGYGMPATPPWKQQQAAGADLPQAIPAEPATATTNPAVMKAKPAQAAEPINEPPPGPDTVTSAPDMQKLVARQKQVIEEAVQQQTQAQKDTQSSTADPSATAAKPESATPETDSYRRQMRKRFDDFLARRKARQNQRTPAPPQQPVRPPVVAAPPPVPVYPQQAIRPPLLPRPPYPQPRVYPQPPVYPQPAYPMAPPQPGYPPQAVQPGYPPYDYRPGAPGWY